MFCCFLPNSRASGQKKNKNQCLLRCRRCWHNLRRLWPFSRSHRPVPQGSPGQAGQGQASTTFISTPEMVEELDDEFANDIVRYKEWVCQTYDTTEWRMERFIPTLETIEELDDEIDEDDIQYEARVGQAYHTTQWRTESFARDIVEELVHEYHFSDFRFKVQVHQAPDAVHAWTECEDKLSLNLNEACGMRALQEGTLTMVAESMLPAGLGGNILHISTFMCIQPTFSIAQQVLDQLFTRSCPPSNSCDAITVFSPSRVMSPYIDPGDTPQDQVKKTIASMVGICPEQVQNFGQLLFVFWVKLTQGFVQVSSPASRLVDHVLPPSVKLELLEPPEAQLEVPPPELQNPPKPEEEPTPGPEHAAATLVLEPASTLNESGCYQFEA